MFSGRGKLYLLSTPQTLPTKLGSLWLIDMKTVLNALSGYISASQASLVATLMLGSVAVYQLASVTWLMIPSGSDTVAQWQPRKVESAASGTVQDADLAAFRKLNLFGKFKKGAAAKPVAVERKTKLKVTLAGIVASSDPAKALAIIEHRGEQDTYGVDDKINGTQATVEQVLAKKVVLRHRGVLENLYLEGEEAKFGVSRAGGRSGSSFNTRNKSKAKAKSKKSQKEDKPDIDVKEIMSSPGKLTEYIKISPVRKSGELKGYRVNPGKDAKLFEAAGLKPNDLAVALNGYDLRSAEDAMQALGELNELESVNVTVDRDGQLVDVYFDVPTQGN